MLTPMLDLVRHIQDTVARRTVTYRTPAGRLYVVHAIELRGYCADLEVIDSETGAYSRFHQMERPEVMTIYRNAGGR